MLSVVPSVDTEVSAAPTFDDFWLLYPKRVSKREAMKAWDRLSPAETVAAIVGLIAWRPIWLANRDLTFVPHASTWIHQCRWEDELPETWGASHASHIPAKLPEKIERAVMPDHVRALIAKLRGK